MNDPTPNVPAMRAVALWLRAAYATPDLFGEPGAPKWDQAMFFQREPDCGTTCCIAGYVSTVLVGGTPMARGVAGSERELAGMVLIDGEVECMDEVAQEYLGLTEEQGTKLFFGLGNDPDHAIALLSEFAGERL